MRTRSALWRRLAVACVMLVPLGAAGLIVPAAAGAAAVHASGVPTAQVSAVGRCDSSDAYGYPNSQYVDYTVSAPDADPNYSGTIRVLGWLPNGSSVSSTTRPLTSSYSPTLIEVAVAANATSASIDLQVTWTGPGLATLTQEVTGSTSLAGGCTSSPSPPPLTGPGPIEPDSCTPNLCVGMEPTHDGRGYWIVRGDGVILTRGDAINYGDLFGHPLNAPIVSMAVTADGRGYWLVGADGGIFSFGDAPFYGSEGAAHLNKPVLAMAATPDGKGYWFVAADGGIFTFGDAAFYGSTGSLRLNQPVVGMTATASGHGYYLVASDGGIFAFGDARFQGSMGGTHLNKPIVGMTTDPNGGYWEVAADGGIFAFGGAPFLGSTGNLHLNQAIVGMTNTSDGFGYRFIARDGGIFDFGDAQFYGSGTGG